MKLTYFIYLQLTICRLIKHFTVIYADANKQFLTLNLIFFLPRKNLPIWDPNLPTKNCRSPYLSPRKYHMYGVDQILYEASLRWGKGCIRFQDKLDQNTGFHGNRKRPLTFNGENDVSTFSRVFLIWFFLYLQVMRTCIKSRLSSNFGQIGPQTMVLAAVERLKNFP